MLRVDIGRTTTWGIGVQRHWPQRHRWVVFLGRIVLQVIWRSDA